MMQKMIKIRKRTKIRRMRRIRTMKKIRKTKPRLVGCHERESKKDEEEREDLIEKKIAELIEKRKKFDTIHSIILLSGLVFGYLSVYWSEPGRTIRPPH